MIDTDAWNDRDRCPSDLCFRSGKSPAVLWLEYGFLFCAIGFAIVVFWAIGPVTLSESYWAKVLTILAAMPLLAVYTRKNWPRAFKPPAIPDDLLPDAR